MGRIRDLIVKPVEWARARKARKEAREEEAFKRMGEILERMGAAMDKATTEEEKEQIMHEAAQEIGRLK